MFVLLILLMGALLFARCEAAELKAAVVKPDVALPATPSTRCAANPSDAEQQGPSLASPTMEMDPQQDLLLLRRLFEKRSHGGRDLQGTDSTSLADCPASVAAAQACLEVNVGSVNTPQRKKCANCYYQRESEALEEYRKRPTINCKLLNDNVCTVVTMWNCLQKCDVRMSALADCKVRALFERVGVNLNCPHVAYRGTNVTFTNDGIVYGYRGKEGCKSGRAGKRQRWLRTTTARGASGTPREASM
jgi:hypothetical protein